MSKIRAAVVEGSPVYKLALAITLACSAIALATAILVAIGVTAPRSPEDTAVIEVLRLILP